MKPFPSRIDVRVRWVLKAVSSTHDMPCGQARSSSILPWIFGGSALPVRLVVARQEIVEEPDGDTALDQAKQADADCES